MALHKWSDHTVQSPPRNAVDLMVDTRKRIAQEQAEATERRHGEIAEQTSMRNPPEQRIRIWERLHGLQLPVKPDHPLLAVVALNTELSIEQVQEEQRHRAEVKAGTAPTVAVA